MADVPTQAELERTRTNMDALNEAAETSDPDARPLAANGRELKPWALLEQVGAAQVAEATVQAERSEDEADRSEIAADVSLKSRGNFPTDAKALSNGVLGYASLVAGSGGTNGTFALGISGGGGEKAAGYFVVAGGALVAIIITASGWDYATAPTFSFANSSGLTGASATAVIGTNVADGYYYNVPSEDDEAVWEVHQNVSGVGTDTGKRYASDAAVSAMASRFRVVGDDEEMANLADYPPHGSVDPVTGCYLEWYDADGKLWTGAGQVGGEGGGGGGGDPSDLISENDNLDRSFAAMDELYGDFDSTDLDGTKRIPKLIDGYDYGVLMIEGISGSSTTIRVLNIYQRADNRNGAGYMRHRFEKIVATNKDYWRYAGTSQMTRLGNSWVFEEVTSWIGAGEQDLVIREAVNGSGFSIDEPGASAGGDATTGLGHGHEYITRPLSMWIDGKAADATSNFRTFARSVRLLNQSKIFRNRTPAEDPESATPATICDKLWTIAGGASMHALVRLTWQEQFTGIALFPLHTVRGEVASEMVTNQMFRDDAFLPLTLPDDITTGGGSEPEERAGVRRVVYAGPTGGIEITVSDLKRYPDGSLHKHSALIEPGFDQHRIKIDLDHKSYFEVGGTQVDEPTTENPYRAADNEVWEREYTLRFLTA